MGSLKLGTKPLMQKLWAVRSYQKGFGQKSMKSSTG